MHKLQRISYRNQYAKIAKPIYEESTPICLRKTHGTCTLLVWLSCSGYAENVRRRTIRTCNFSSSSPRSAIWRFEMISVNFYLQNLTSWQKFWNIRCLWLSGIIINGLWVCSLREIYYKALEVCKVVIYWMYYVKEFEVSLLMCHSQVVLVYIVYVVFFNWFEILLI